MSNYIDEEDMTDADWRYVDMYVEEQQSIKHDEREKAEKEKAEKEEADANNKKFRESTMKDECSSIVLGIRGDTLCFDCFKSLTKDTSWTMGNKNYCISCARSHLSP